MINSSIYSPALRTLIRLQNRDYYYPIENFGIFNFEGIPSFIRFHEVDLRYIFTGEGSIKENCLRLKNLLQSLKQYLEDSISVIYFGKIANDHDLPNYFTDHSQLIAYFRDDFLPILDSSRHYSFEIRFTSDKDAAASVIESLLQMPQIERCSNVAIGINYANPTQLPVDSIFQFLNQKKCDQIIRKTKEKFLKIRLGKIQNVSNLCDHFIKVNFM